MAYFINKIPNSLYKNKQYHFIKGLDGTIDLRSNYWYLKLYLLSYNNFALPPNSLISTLRIPCQTINNITFNLCSDQSIKQKYKNINNQYCKVYEAICAIDISGNQYLKQNLSNAKINCQLNFEIDPLPISKISNNSINQTDLDSLINETYELEWNFDVYYSNTYYLSNNNSICECINSYHIDPNNQVNENKGIIKAIVNDYMDWKKPIINLVTLKSTEPFQVLKIKIKFFYQIDGISDQHSYELNLFKSNIAKYETSINCETKTLFNNTNNQIFSAINGIYGFYIPKYASGYYQINFNLLQNNNNVNFYINNPFHFSTNNNFPKIKILSKVFEQMDDFTKWIIND